MKVNFKGILALLLIIGVMITLVSMFSSGPNASEALGYSDLVGLFEEDRVTSFKVDQNLRVTLKALEKDENGNVTDKEKTYTYTLSYSFQLDEINRLAYDNYTKYLNDPTTSNLKEYNYDPAQETPWYEVYLPFIITGVILVVLFIFVMRQTGAAGPGKMNSFAKSHAKVGDNGKNPVRFADVAGADEEKAELEEVVEFLKDPHKFMKLGARIPRGVLLVGPPGTGKTLLAKAVAGEAGVPFFSISGSDFVEMYVGVGASRVRDLFENARKTPASIIFIDEIDAVGRHRGAGLGGGHDEREQTLNQLLVEMDGFGTNSGVIVMAATNRPDILDPALLRPGRFDRTVTVNYPDIKGREEILRVHTRNKPLEDTVDLHKIALTTIGFTGAELANLMNEAALRAAKKNKTLIGMEDIEEAYMKMLLGPQKKTRVRSDEDNKLTAYHEAGHAVAAYYCKSASPVKHITIIPAGNAGGVTIRVPTQEQFTISRNQMIDNIVVSLGGRVAEEIILDDISTGASSDIQNATKIARNMVMRYGMSEKLGPILYGSDHSSDEVFLGRDFSSGNNYSPKTAAEIDDEIRAIIENAHSTCREILTEHIDKLHFVAEFLLKNESMDEEQFAAAMSMENPTIEAIEAIASEKRQKSEEENREQREKNQKEEEERAQMEAQMAQEEAPDAPTDDTPHFPF